MRCALVAVLLDKLQQGFGQRQPSLRLIGRHAEKIAAALGCIPRTCSVTSDLPRTTTDEPDHGRIG